VWHHGRPLMASLQVPHARTLMEWTTSAAPESQDIIWANLAYGFTEKQFRGWLSLAATACLILFYVVPITFVQALTSLCACGGAQMPGTHYYFHGRLLTLGPSCAAAELEKTIPALGPLVDSHVILKGLLQGLLPTLVLTAFMALLPILLRGQGFELASARWPCLNGSHRVVVSPPIIFNLVLSADADGRGTVA
jgi:hypothetical protein